MNKWFEQLESKIFTIVSYRTEKALRGKTANIRFTTDGVSDSQAYFPTVYLHELQSAEQGNDLTNTTINAILYTMEAQTYSKSKGECRAIMSEITAQMKALGFNITAMPITTSDGNVVQSVARFRRMIGGGDTDLVDVATT